MRRLEGYLVLTLINKFITFVSQSLPLQLQTLLGTAEEKSCSKDTQQEVASGSFSTHNHVIYEGRF